jgi:hypothetical protein
VSALSADPAPPSDPLDPELILSALPTREREMFLTQYRQAVNDALDPAGWKELRRFLRLWAKRALAVGQPGYYQARDAARQGTGGGMALERALLRHRTGQ